MCTCFVLECNSPNLDWVAPNFAQMANHGRVAFETLGCKLNFSESSALANGLIEAGYARVAVDDHPDVVVVNTCSVTDHADAKCRNIVRRAKGANP